MNPCINVTNIPENPSIKSAQDVRRSLLSEGNRPKISLAVPKCDEFPKLVPYTRENRCFFIYLTLMQALQALLNILISIVVRQKDPYCDVLIDTYILLIILFILFIIINLLIIVCIRVFRKKAWATIGLILYYLIEAYIMAMATCEFNTLYIRFINIMLIIDFFGLCLYLYIGVLDRISLIRSIPYVLTFNTASYLAAFFSTRVEIYESIGSYLACNIFSFFYVWLIKMIHLKKIHGNLDLMLFRIISPALLQIDMFFLTFFSIFFIGV